MTERTRITLCGIAIGVAVALFSSPDARAGMCPVCVNSATVGDGILFDELNVKGYRRPGGPRLKRATLGGAEVNLHVKDQFLTATSTSITPERTYANEELMGLVIEVEMEDCRAYQAKIVKVNGCTAEQLKQRPQEAEAEAKAKTKARNPKGKEAPQVCVPHEFWVAPKQEIPHFEFLVKKVGRRQPALPSGPACAFPPAPAPPPASAAASPASPRSPATARTSGKYDKKVPDNAQTKLPEAEDRPLDPDFDKAICRGEYLEKDEPVENGTRRSKLADYWKGIEHSAVAFEGDHYDPDTKVVTETAVDDGWFNLACAGTAVYKMHRLRHTRAGSKLTGSPLRKTTLAQRTAMLKAITADYCGDGTAWTADGTPLDWTDSQGWFPRRPFFPRDPLDLPTLARRGLIEGVWGPDGAMCLNDPRRRSNRPTLVFDQDGCTRPAVTKSEVVDACRATGKVHRKYPTGLVDVASASQKIPPCDEEWIKQWKAIKGPNAPHVITANRTDNLRIYCDRAP